MWRCFAAIALFTCAVAGGQEPTGLRWTPAYKIKPNETERLTAADVVGPDGIEYPDWRYAGVPGGTPSVPAAANVDRFGAKVNDDQDEDTRHANVAST